MSFSSCSTEPTCARTCDCISGPCKCEWQTKLLISTTDTPSPMQMNHAAYSAAQAHGAEAFPQHTFTRCSTWVRLALLRTSTCPEEVRPNKATLLPISHGGDDACNAATNSLWRHRDSRPFLEFYLAKNHYCDCETTAREKEKQCLPRGAISYVLLDLLLS